MALTSTRPRWELAITHRGRRFDEFVDEYMGDPCRKLLLIAGAGFDPRTAIVAEHLSATGNANIRGMFIKESRIGPDHNGLQDMAGRNFQRLELAVGKYDIISVEIFGADGSVVGGRRAAEQLSRRTFSEYTDVVVDVSALSVGVSFPVIRYLMEVLQTGRDRFNLHVMVAHEPSIDAMIRAVPTDTTVSVHGFNGGLSLLSGGRRRAKLWLPQLAYGRAASLRRIHEQIAPDEVCAVVPFPARDPRLGDALLEDLIEQGDRFPWEMDARSIVYADEGDPLDLYRTILKLYMLRQPVFEGVGGSHLIVSPIGSKVMALGALLAALEKDLPVVHLEDFDYELHGDLNLTTSDPELLHIWLEGDPYSSERPRPLGDKS